jgi:hypothetical protein
MHRHSRRVLLFLILALAAGALLLSSRPASAHLPGAAPAPDAPLSPVLTDVAVGPAVTAPGSLLVFTYTVSVTQAQSVALGAAVRPHGEVNWVSDPPRDRTVALVVGSNVVTRTYQLDNTPNQTYDALWTVNSTDFTTTYDMTSRDSVVTTTAAPPTATPTNTAPPTNTPTITTTPTQTRTPTATNTPTHPVLQDVSLDPTTAYRFGYVTLYYTVFSPAAQQIALGADMAPTGTNNFEDDQANNRVVSINAGVTTVSRIFAIGSRAAGSYDVRWGIFDSTFTTNYDLVRRDNALTIDPQSATNTPTVTNTPTATATPIQVCSYNITASANATIVPGTTLLDRSNNCTDCTSHIDLPAGFQFQFYGEWRTMVRASSNGNLQFDTATGITNGCLPEPSLGPSIMPYFEDLDLSSPGDGIYTSVTGIAPDRVYNIEWRGQRNGTTNRVHFEVRLYEGQSRFDMIYDQVDNNSLDAAVGVQKDTTTYQQYGGTCHAGGLSHGLMLTYLGSCATPTATSTSTPIATATPTATTTSVPASNTPTQTTVPATNTPTQTTVPATSTSTQTAVAPTNTPTQTSIPASNTPTQTGVPASNTPTETTVPASNTPTETSIPASSTATATNSPTSTQTATSVPPANTATATSVPPANTATATSVPPSATATQAPPSATATTPPSVTPCPIAFSDVPPGSTFYAFIRCLSCQSIVGGYSDNTFRPGANVTRGQVAKFVSNAAGYTDAVPADRQTFTDVPPGSTFWLFIERAAAHGVISGYSDHTFRPGANVTRGQVAKFVANAAGFADDVTGRQTFTDVDANNPFWLFIERAYAHSVISGYNCGQAPAGPCDGVHLYYFLPGNNVTRGQTAKFISNSFFPNCQVPR